MDACGRGGALSLARLFRKRVYAQRVARAGRQRLQLWRKNFRTRSAPGGRSFRTVANCTSVGVSSHVDLAPNFACIQARTAAAKDKSKAPVVNVTEFGYFKVSCLISGVAAPQGCDKPVD